MNINDITKKYGFEIENKMFMDENTAYIQVPVYQTRSMGWLQVREQRMEPVTKPVMIRVTPENINTKLSISNKISDLFYMYGTRLLVHDDILKENDLSARTLFTSSHVSWTREGMGYGPVDSSPPASENVLRNQPLGVLVEGKFKSAYEEDDMIPVWPKEPGAKGEEDEEKVEEEQPVEFTGEGKDNKFESGIEFLEMDQGASKILSKYIIAFNKAKK